MLNIDSLDDHILKILSKKDGSGRIISRESSILEFKENFNFGSIAEYGKIMASFANNTGGFIIFGVKDSPRVLIGVNFRKFNEIKQEKITSFLLNHFTPEINWEIGIIKNDSKYFGYLYVFNTENKPVICKMDSSKYIKNGEIYYRYRSQTKKIEHAELSEIIGQIKQKESNNWMSLFKKIAEIGPENSALLDIFHGKIEGKKGTLLIDKKIIPKLSFIQKGKFKENGRPTLRLIGDVKPIFTSKDKRFLKIKTSNDPNAPIVRITDDEIKKLYPWDFKKLVKELNHRYSDFKQNKKFYNIKKQCACKNIYSFRRFLNPDNPKSTHQDFYSKNILKEFDKHYKK